MAQGKGDAAPQANHAGGPGTSAKHEIGRLLLIAAPLIAAYVAEFAMALTTVSKLLVMSTM